MHWKLHLHALCIMKSFFFFFGGFAFNKKEIEKVCKYMREYLAFTSFVVVRDGNIYPTNGYLTQSNPIGVGFT